MNGAPLSSDGAEMRDIVAYLWFVSRDVPIAPPSATNRLAQWASLTPDTAAGARVYGAPQGAVSAPALAPHVAY